MTKWSGIIDKDQQSEIPVGAWASGIPEIVKWTRETTELRLTAQLERSAGKSLPNDLTHAEVAYVHDAFVRLGNPRPTESVAESMGVTPATVRNRVYRARRHGLLGPTTKGEPGGRLTIEGWAQAERGPHFEQVKHFVSGLFGEGKTWV